ncbi:MAG: excinuclease ABC subunit B, partial [Bacteroidetes bacterium]|nr:excinuclease ABC subunit B [Bacteroidota bacterium]
VLVTTLTKKMAEELFKYFSKLNIRARYIHSDVDTLERVEILRDLRLGLFDVLIGVNLLREGLDLPEVSLVAILDADKEGFLRSSRSLVQTVGRAARNVNGLAIMYADKITESMRKTIDETQRRRLKQIQHNFDHGIIPTQITKSKDSIMRQTKVADSNSKDIKVYGEAVEPGIAADPVIQYMSKEQLEKTIVKTRKSMESAAKEFDFLMAAKLRDELYAYQELLKTKD